MYLESLTINFMAWSHEELDGISYRTEECVCVCFQVSQHTHPCALSEHPLPTHNTQHTDTEKTKKSKNKTSKPVHLPPSHIRR